MKGSALFGRDASDSEMAHAVTRESDLGHAVVEAAHARRQLTAIDLRRPVDAENDLGHAVVEVAHARRQWTAGDLRRPVDVAALRRPIGGEMLPEQAATATSLHRAVGEGIAVLRRPMGEQGRQGRGVLEHINVAIPRRLPPAAARHQGLSHENESGCNLDNRRLAMCRRRHRSGYRYRRRHQLRPQ
jgi:hypothetical protein